LDIAERLSCGTGTYYTSIVVNDLVLFQETSIPEVHLNLESRLTTGIDSTHHDLLTERIISVTRDHPPLMVAVIIAIAGQATEAAATTEATGGAVTAQVTSLAAATRAIDLQVTGIAVTAEGTDTTAAAPQGTLAEATEGTAPVAAMGTVPVAAMQGTDPAAAAPQGTVKNKIPDIN
jgi:hypothetical protein